MPRLAERHHRLTATCCYLSTDSSRTTTQLREHGQPATIKASWEGIKIFDISDQTNPQYIKAVETNCGSHTHTLVPGDASDYIYVSTTSPQRDFPDCQPPHDLISIVKVPHDGAEDRERRRHAGPLPRRGPGQRRPTTGCHDITAYPSKGIAAGACMGDGVIMDISDPEKPAVIETVRDTNFAFWHSATFNNKGTKVVFTDELGGGGAATCNEAIGPNRGANAIYELSAGNELDLRVVLQDPAPPEGQRELRRPQRVDRPPPRS